MADAADPNQDAERAEVDRRAMREKLCADKEFVGQMQDELLALLMAWVDRGITIGDAAILTMGGACAIISSQKVLTLGQAVSIMVTRWEDLGGDV